MRAEDIREGMWLRHQHGPVVRVCGKAEAAHGWVVVFSGGTEGMIGTGDASWWEPCAPPEAKPADDELDAFDHAVIDALEAEVRKAQKHFDRVIFEAAEESRQALKPRDHNTACSRCGGRAYQGIGLAKCVEPVCDDPETREPDSVSCQSVRVRKARAGGGLPYEPARYERVYVAEGRGVSRPHPTPEGAIQAWREAVRGGATMGKP